MNREKPLTAEQIEELFRPNAIRDLKDLWYIYTHQKKIHLWGLRYLVNILERTADLEKRVEVLEKETKENE